MYAQPQDYALSVGASGDEAAWFHAYRAEFGMATGYHQPTEELWTAFRAQRDRPAGRWSRGNDR
ncbi:hypothetical protein BJF78_30115 [Pseudonocardia sp. CNS-139]|nr:hypothetical protein BJF78_30115 [Pseudonocardia sp. CNS-139]